MLELVRLTEVNKSEIITLMNHPLVQRHMPLASAHFNENDCNQFIEMKEKLWNDHGYGPWACILNGKFIGWGGLQPEGADVEIALVLHPKYWGLGKMIYDRIIHYAFEILNLKSVVILFPPSRRSIKVLFRMGFEKDGEQIIEGETFLRYRLLAFRYKSSNTSDC